MIRIPKSMLAVRLEAEKYEKFFDNPKYVAQEKLKGIRAFLVKDDDKLFIITRGGHEVGRNFPHILSALKQAPFKSLVLDGELYKRGVEDEVIAGLANRTLTDPRDSAYVEYWAFDVLYSENSLAAGSYVDLDQQTRMDILEWWIEQDILDPPIHILPWCLTNHEAFLLSVWENGGEGIILKNLDSPYIEGPSRKRNHWWKIKSTESFDVVITGWKAGAGKFEGMVGAFEYGMYLKTEDRDVPILLPLGFCSGINMEVRQSMTDSFDLWMHQVVEVSAAGQDPNSFALIEPRFNRVRTDKRPEECVLV